MPQSANRAEKMVTQLKRSGCRITPQRLAIVDILAGSKEHPSVEQIYAEMKPNFPATSLATVYKTIALLKELGEVLELGFGTGNNHYDGFKPFSHPHLMCLDCKKIIDVELSKIKNYPAELQEKTGYEIHNYQMNFIGLCPNCQNNHEHINSVP